MYQFAKLVKPKKNDCVVAIRNLRIRLEKTTNKEIRACLLNEMETFRRMYKQGI